MRVTEPRKSLSSPRSARVLASDHPVVVTLLVFAVIAFMSLASEVLKPLALAILLSFALAPLARFIEHRGLPRFLAVMLTIILALGVLTGIGLEVGRQLTRLASHADEYEKNITAKLTRLDPNRGGTIEKLTKVSRDVTTALDNPTQVPGAVSVNVVSRVTFQQRLQEAVGPYLESLAVGAFVFILVLFILANRDDLRERIVHLMGQGRVSLTTKTMEEVGQRMSRYLGMVAIVNSTIGLIVWAGLSAIGLHYAALWGVLAALLRFIPYVGPATAFALPLLFSVADTPDPSMRQPLLVAGLFVVMELLANSFFEPVIYGKTTGVSALGLLVAAMFWTWLWGSLGLLLSTPLTVCLAVLGKSIPALGFFATLLGEEAPLDPDVRYYERLLAMDEDGADEMISAALKRQPRIEVFDQVLVPTIIRCDRDRARDRIDDREHAFIWRVIRDLLDELAETPEITLKAPASPGPERDGEELAKPPARVLGVAASDEGDLLILKMLALLLSPEDCSLEIISAPDSPLELAEQVADFAPALLVLSVLPTVGAAHARYFVRRLRARFADLPIVVGRWGLGEPPAGTATTPADGLTTVGATAVASQLGMARERILERVHSKSEPAALGAAGK